MHAGHAWQELQGLLRQLRASEAPECFDDFVQTVLEAADECARVVKAGEKAASAGAGAAAAQAAALKKEIRRVYNELTACTEAEAVPLARLDAIADAVCDLVAAATTLRDRVELFSSRAQSQAAQHDPGQHNTPQHDSQLLFEMDS